MSSIQRFITPLLIGMMLAALMDDPPSRPLAAQDLAMKNVHRTFGMIPMEDGVALSYVVYRPEADGRFPALFTYGPYLGGGLDLGAHGGFSAEARDYLRHGYAVVSVSTRGTGCSTGSFQVLSEREAKDGAAVVEWIGRQPWCTGAVGLFGYSYLGLTQYMIASQRPKHLKAMAAGAAAGDPYRDMAYPGGIFNSSYGAYWSYYVQLHQERQGLSAWRRRLDPSCQEIRAEVLPKPTFHQMKEHPFRDTWWQARSFERMATSIEVPVLIIHAWQDQSISVRGAVGLYDSIQTPKKLLLANGEHAFYTRPGVQAERVRWFDYWLKGKRNEIDQEPPVTVWFEHRVRDDEWRPGWRAHYADWPVPETQWQDFYLTAEGKLGDRPPARGPASGKRNCIYPAGTELVSSNETFQLAPLAFGTLVYQTDPTLRDTTIVGSPVLTFYLSSENVDTDFMVALHDVHPDGQVQYLQRGFLRASHRRVDPVRSSPYRPYHPHDRADPLTPSEVVEIQIEFPPVGHVVRRGHRLELALMAPSATPNLLWGFAPIMLPGINTVQHSRRYPSSLLLPVIPGASAQAGAPPCGSLPNQPCRKRSVTPALGANP